MFNFDTIIENSKRIRDGRNIEYERTLRIDETSSPGVRTMYALEKLDKYIVRLGSSGQIDSALRHDTRSVRFVYIRYSIWLQHRITVCVNICWNVLK